MVEDYYQLLGIEDDATQEEVKKAYRRLAKELHPDINSDKTIENAEKFKRIKDAYEILSNPFKRERYDLNLMRERQGQGQNRELKDRSNTLSKYTGPPLAPQKGADVKLNLSISFEESFHGVKKTINVNMPIICSYCSGSGASPNTPISQCPTCKGSGALLTPVQTGQGLINQRIVCSTCNGRGILMQQFCLMCSGVGLVNGYDTVSITIPPGVEDGAVIKMNQKGGHGLGRGPPGDLYITVMVEDDPRMRRVDNDLYIDEVLSFPKAYFGGKQRVLTPDGKRALRIPPRTKSRMEFIIEGEGFPDPVTGEHGNLYIVVYIDPPESLDDDSEKLLKKYSISSGEDMNDLGI